MMKRILGTALFLLLGSAASVRAQCTGSGIAWSCPSGTTAAQLATAISAASNNAVITFANGSYTWSSNTNFSATKGATLICATGATCTINSTGTVLGLQGFSGTLPNLYRISGFTFNTINSGQAIIWFDVINPGGRGQINQLRIDHNIFNMNATAAGTVAFFGDTQSNGYYYGVIDHNTINAVNAVAFVFWIGKYDITPPTNSPQGTASNLFVEDNTLNVITNTNASVPCATDAWGFAAMVFRHNTITNCAVPVHDLGHAGGPANWEVYNNQFILNSGASTIGISDGYRMVHHQGAQEEMFWNNSFTPLTEPHNGSTLSVTAGYVDSDCTTYPCFASPTAYGAPPGRDNSGILRPIYVWGNFDTNNGTLVVGGNESSGTYVAQNRDLYNSVSTNAQTSPSSPFDGTVGMGFGTLANRPTTCTHSNPTNPTASGDAGHGGVGYAVETVVGTIGASAGAGVASDAVLYSCTATNTWTVAYTPYTYPHPLVTGSGGVSGAPAPPTNVAVSVQ